MLLVGLLVASVLPLLSLAVRFYVGYRLPSGDAINHLPTPVEVRLYHPRKWRGHPTFRGVFPRQYHDDGVLNPSPVILPARRRKVEFNFARPSKLTRISLIFYRWEKSPDDSGNGSMVIEERILDLPPNNRLKDGVDVEEYWLGYDENRIWPEWVAGP